MSSLASSHILMPTFISSSMGTMLEVFWSTVYAVVVLFFVQHLLPLVFKYLRPKSEPELVEKKWRKDVVYLYVMPGSDKLPTISPYCLKVETFLRVNQIAYERRYLVLGRGTNGKLPFVELNGKHITDSQTIINRLRFLFKVKEEYTDAEEAAYGRAVERMVDNHTFNVFVHYKAPTRQLLKGLLGGPAVPDLLVDVLHPFLSPIISSVMAARNKPTFGEFSEAEYRELARRDLQAYQDMLGNKNYLFGNKMTSADCAVFGHLAALYYSGARSHPIFLLQSHQFIPLRNYIERVKDNYFGSKFQM